MVWTSRILTVALALAGAGVGLAGCNPATMGWSSKEGKSVGYSRLAGAKSRCQYHESRERAVRLLDQSAALQYENRKKAGLYTRRAGEVLNKADKCMRRYGLYYRPNHYYAVGKGRKRLHRHRR